MCTSSRAVTLWSTSFPMALLVSSLTDLFVTDVEWRSDTVERKHLELPPHGYRGWHVAHRPVTGLILELAVNGYCLSFHGNGAPECRARTDLYILTNAEGTLENGHLLFDDRQVKSLGLRINRRFELDFGDRIND